MTLLWRDYNIVLKNLSSELKRRHFCMQKILNFVLLKPHKNLGGLTLLNKSMECQLSKCLTTHLVEFCLRLLDLFKGLNL